MKLADYKATLQFSNGKEAIDMPVYQGNIGPDVIDIRKLYGQSGMFTYDPGFLSTASCQSAITFIDGDKGELLYRGYPIEQLATNCNYLETCHLLLYGELPNAQRKKELPAMCKVQKLEFPLNSTDTTDTQPPPATALRDKLFCRRRF